MNADKQSSDTDMPYLGVDLPEWPTAPPSPTPTPPPGYDTATSAAAAAAAAAVVAPAPAAIPQPTWLQLPGAGGDQPKRWADYVDDDDDDVERPLDGYSQSGEPHATITSQYLKSVQNTLDLETSLAYYYDESTGKVLTLHQLNELYARGGSVASLQTMRNDLGFRKGVENTPSASNSDIVVALRDNKIQVARKEQVTKTPDVTHVAPKAIAAKMRAWATPPRGVNDTEWVKSVFLLFQMLGVYPQYNVTYFVGPQDLDLMFMAERLHGNGKYTTEMEELADFSQKYYYGSGSLDGQLARFKKVEAVHDQIMAAARKKGNSVDPEYDKWRKIMDLRYPLAARNIKLTETTMDGMDRELGAQGLNAVVVNKASNEGPCWPRGTTRINVLPQSMYYADKLMEIAQAHAWDRDKFLRDFPWVTLAYMKPKAEVYPLGEPKTRNFYGFTGFPQTPVQIAINAPRNAKHTLLSHDTSWSMLGLSQYSGNHDKFIRRMLGDRNFVGIYSDNLFCRGHLDSGGRLEDVWLSLDGEKMEASTTFKTATHMLRRSLECFDESGRGAQMLKGYVLMIGAHLMTRTIGLLGNQQIPIPGMASGVIGTTQANHERMTWATAQAIPTGGPTVTLDGGRMVLKEADALLHKGGCIVTIERVIPIATFNGPPNQVLDIDLLGFSTYHFVQYGIDAWFPVLQVDRLRKMLLWLKVKPKEYAKVSVAIKLARLRMAYLCLGAWAYPALAELIVRLCEHYLVKDSLRDVNSDEVGLLGEELARYNVPKEVSLPLLARRAVPMFGTVLKLMASGTAQFEQWMVGWFKAAPQTVKHTFEGDDLIRLSQLVPGVFQPGDERITKKKGAFVIELLPKELINLRPPEVRPDKVRGKPKPVPLPARQKTSPPVLGQEATVDQHRGTLGSGARWKALTVAQKEHEISKALVLYETLLSEDKGKPILLVPGAWPDPYNSGKDYLLDLVATELKINRTAALKGFNHIAIWLVGKGGEMVPAASVTLAMVKRLADKKTLTEATALDKAYKKYVPEKKP